MTGEMNLYVFFRCQIEGIEYFGMSSIVRVKVNARNKISQRLVTHTLILHWKT